MKKEADGGALGFHGGFGTELKPQSGEKLGKLGI